MLPPTPHDTAPVEYCQAQVEYKMLQKQRCQIVDFAQALQTLMKLKGYTMYRLAKEMPCSQSAVKKWLEGSMPNPVMRARITEILGELPIEAPASTNASGVSVNPRYYELSASDRAAVDALIDHFATTHQSDD